jgi:RNA polymerase sigma-70 factor (ECF subfamily)
MRASKPPLQDPEAFSQLYARSQLIIFRYIYGCHGGPIEEVEDITCDVYMRAWKSRDRFWGDDHDALCWLFTIAHRLVIDAHRRMQVHPEAAGLSLEDAAGEWLVVSAETTPEEQVSSREQFKHLWRILHDLPDDKREVVVLRYMLGWKVKEIAQYLHKEENTVSVYIRRCLEQIRENWTLD